MTVSTGAFWAIVGAVAAGLEIYKLVTGGDTLSRAAWNAQRAHPTVGLFAFFLAYHLITPGSSAVPFLVAFVAMLVDLHFGGPQRGPRR